MHDLTLPDAAAVNDIPIPQPLATRLAELSGAPQHPASIGELAGHWGSTLRANWKDMLLAPGDSPHEVRFDATSLHVNCAMDALLLPYLAQQAATVLTEDPVTGEQITAFVGSARQPAASHPQAVLALGVSGAGTDVHECACPNINLFASRPVFETWRRENPDVESMGLELAEAVVFVRTLAAQGEAIQLS